jgi:queuine tRNA-ribosyltransferase
VTDPIFSVRHSETSSEARIGILELPHGKVSTPVFMPVGTNGTVKALTRDDLEEIGFEIILSNTYHLYLRPGTDVIGAAGGLHEFMRWRRNILTDSGGFQVFSLARLRKIQDDGVRFQSHVDGSWHVLGPESASEIQAVLGSDIQMQLDVCTGWDASRTEAEKALAVTADWLSRAKITWEKKREEGYRGSLFAIVQGGFFKDLREQSARIAAEADTPGIAIGGLSVGEPAGVFAEMLAHTASLLPKDKPRYVMGIGTPAYILEAIGQGIDMFDCVLPTRTGRNGLVFSRDGAFALKKAENRLDFKPIDEECGCKVCREYSRAYLRHLFKTGEILCSMLASYHNLYFLHELVLNARKAIEENRFVSFKKDFLSRFEGKKDKL